MCNVKFLPISSAVRKIDLIWRRHISHVFSLVCDVLPKFEYTNCSNSQVVHWEILT